MSEWKKLGLPPLHETELPAVMVWLVDCVINVRQFGVGVGPIGDGLGDGAPGVGVGGAGVGVGDGGPRVGVGGAGVGVGDGVPGVGDGPVIVTEPLFCSGDDSFRSPSINMKSFGGVRQVNEVESPGFTLTRFQ